MMPNGIRNDKLASHIRGPSGSGKYDLRVVSHSTMLRGLAVQNVQVLDFGILLSSEGTSR
jgi:hypothetical protein